MRLRSAIPATTLGLLAIAAGTASALSHAAEEPQPTRLQAYLHATQLELAGTGHDIDSIAEPTQVAGLEIFLLQGPHARCLLTAAADQPDGHSQQLACTRDASDSQTHPLATTTSTPARPDARIDAIALPPTATDISVTSEADRDQAPALIATDPVTLVTRESAADVATLSWVAGGDRHELRLSPDPTPAGDDR